LFECHLLFSHHRHDLALCSSFVTTASLVFTVFPDVILLNVSVLLSEGIPGKHIFSRFKNTADGNVSPGVLDWRAKTGQTPRNMRPYSDCISAGIGVDHCKAALIRGD
jgi:hypothetical protein